MRVLLQPAFILHHRPYRETSRLIDIFTEDYGRITLIARGSRSHRSPWRPLLQPFVPLLLSWQGRSELMTLSSAESNGGRIFLYGDNLLSGFYLNELLMKVLQKDDPYPGLYTIYQHTLLELKKTTLEQTLRIFEKKLLEALGYGLPLYDDFSTGEPLMADVDYCFHPNQGFKQYNTSSSVTKEICFKGKSLLALAAEQLNNEEQLRDIKRLMRLAMGDVLGFKPLCSRQLFYKTPLKDEEE